MNIKSLQLFVLAVLYFVSGCAAGEKLSQSPSVYDYSDAGWLAWNEQQYDAAERQFNLMLKKSIVNKIKALKNPRYVQQNPHVTLESLKEPQFSRGLVRVYYSQGRYLDALEMESRRFKSGYSSVQDSEREEAMRHFDIRGDCLASRGEWDKARLEYDASVKIYMEAARDLGISDVEEGQLHEKRGVLAMHQGAYEEAISLLKQNVHGHAKVGAIWMDQIGYASYLYAQALYLSGDEEQCLAILNEALKTPNAFGADYWVVVKITMLRARIRENQGQPEEARALYQACLDRLRGEWMHATRAFRVEQADLLTAFGAFQLRQGNPEEADTSFNQALALRRETASAMHPNVGDIYKGLADVSAVGNELTSASLHADQSLSIFDAAILPTHPRIAPALISNAAIHLLSGQPEAAEPFFTRLETILEKPLGPWKEDFLDTTQFYADLLAKAGKPAEAERLQAYYDRQKDLR